MERFSDAEKTRSERHYGPQTLRRWLECYPELCVAVEQGCSVDAPGPERAVQIRVSRGRPRPRAGSFNALACVKCDLEQAMSRALTPRGQMEVLLYYWCGFTVEQVGHIMGVAKQTVSDRLREAVIRMSRHLSTGLPTESLVASIPEMKLAMSRQMPGLCARADRGMHRMRAFRVGMH